MDESIIHSIPGADQLIERYGQFGHWPNFADFEVIEIVISRRSSSWLMISLDTFDAKAEWKQIPNEVVKLEFTEVLDLDLVGYHVQNVIGGLDITREADGFVITIAYCTGIRGWIKVSDIGVHLLNLADQKNGSN